MRVLFNALQANNRSGTGRYAFELLRALCEVEGDHEITALLPKELVAAFSDTPQLRCIGVSTGPLRRILYERFQLPPLAKNCGAKLVHFPANFGRCTGNAPLLLTVHDLSFLRHPEWFRADRAAYYRSAIRASVRGARRIIADSESTASDLRELLGVDAAKVDVIPLGVSPDFRPAAEREVAALRGRYGLPERYVLYAGTLEPRKNLARLVGAWSRVANTIDADLVLAGRSGWKNDTLDAAIAASPKRARIHRPGFIAQEDLPALLSGAAAFAFPSLFEGFGLPPLEAMACGTPVLCSNTSSLPEVVGDAAVLADPEDVDALAAGLCDVLADRERLAALGRERAAQFTWQRCAKLTLDTYRRALES